MKYSLSFISVLTNKLIELNTDDLIKYYLSWRNEFLTIDRFAEYYNFTRYEASRIIDVGRSANEPE